MDEAAVKPPLQISPIHADYYCIHFHAWDGLVAQLLSGMPDNAARKAEIELVLGHPVELIPTPADKILEMNRRCFGVGASSVVRIPDPASGDGKLAGTSQSPASPARAPAQLQEAGSSKEAGPALDRISSDPSIIRFVDRLIEEAFKDRATDIHIEPYEDRVDIRYRVDGVLHAIPAPAEVKDLHRAIVSRLKILSHLDIAEQRLPQDGRFRFVLKDGQELDIRISVLPTRFGEAVDLRLLTTRQVYTGLGSLGLGERDQEKMAEILKRPHGVVLVTGPTGSGKTTTLYAFLSLLNQSHRKIITIEDPIEYQIPGLTQIQVQPKIELTFARGLRSMLRHDPDIMMVGEIRDYETVDTTIQVALTGHLVFSTVHTNDAPSTPARLVNMGAEPYLVASSLECVIAQRLVRLICDHCRETVPPDADPLLREASENIREWKIPWDGSLGRGCGCEHCMGTGYRGRTAVFEIMPVSEEIQSVILNRGSATTLRAAAVKEGFKSMRWDGLAKVAAHKTTYEEVLRVTRKETY
jgi:general secretion pathway protein E